MTAATVTERVASHRERAIACTVSDTLVLAQRGLTSVLRTPRTVVFVIAQPVLFLLLFTAVLSETVVVPGVQRYADQLVPAIVILAVSGAALGPGVTLLADLDGGLLDRLRSSPIARGALVSGLAVAAVGVTILALGALLAAGFATGFRFRAGPWATVGFLALAVGCGVAWIWVSLALALATRSQEAVRQSLQLGSFVLLFGSGAFVPVATLPGWFQPLARANPVTPATEALLALSAGGPTARPVTVTLAWIVGTCLVCATFTFRRYQRLE